MRLFSSIAVAGVLLMSAPLAAEPADVAAAVANPDRGEPDLALDESRQPEAVLAFLGLEQGDSVLDVFAGGGYYTELMARAVGPEGFVLGLNPPLAREAFNLGPVFEARNYGERVPNAAEFNLAFADFVLPPESVDFTLFHLVFHDLWFVNEPTLPAVDQHVFLERLYAATKPGGIVGIVDHVGVNAADPAAEAAAVHRISPTVVRTAMTNAGFEFVEEAEFLANADDDAATSVFDPSIRGRTNRFVYRFRRPAE